MPVAAAYSDDFRLPEEEEGGTIGRLAEAARQIARDIRLEHLYAMTGRNQHNPRSYERPERVTVQHARVHALVVALGGIYPIVPGSSGNRWQQAPYDGPIKVSAALRLLDEPHPKPWTERVWGLYGIPVRQLTDVLGAGDLTGAGQATHRPAGRRPHRADRVSTSTTTTLQDGASAG